MGRFVKGDVVVAPFPFSDLSAAKRRPALVVASLTGDDVILCQITSKAAAIPHGFNNPTVGRDFLPWIHDTEVAGNTAKWGCYPTVLCRRTRSLPRACRF
jgi:hypothetical protein